MKRVQLVMAAACALAAVLGPAAGTSSTGQTGPSRHEAATVLARTDLGKSQGRQHPYNVIFVICDQECYGLRAKDDYQLPARQALKNRGITFRNHYISSAVCTPSRAVIFTGQPPQVNGVHDHLAFGYTPSLRPDLPNAGSVFKGLGYQTAYFGKFELNSKVLAAKRTDNTSTALQPYGFDAYNADGDFEGGVLGGYDSDAYIAGQGLRWLRSNAEPLRQKGQPFFMVLSFVNPHDVMFIDTNPRGAPAVQKAIANNLLQPPPASAIYERKWASSLPPSLGESHKAPGMPPAIHEYAKGWSDVFGVIPTDRKDMWAIYYNYYLNCLRDNDRSMEQFVNAMTDMDLWKDTVVILTADHGDMGGAHGGLRGKGPLCYEENAHVPMVVVHPEAKGGKSCAALTCHLDLLPTFLGLAGIAEKQRPPAVNKLPGRDFSVALRGEPDKAKVDALRPGILFNYVSLSTVDATYYPTALVKLAQGKKPPGIADINLNKRGFLAFTFDGRYKLGRFYAPHGFNTPKTLEQLLQANDVQVFDLQTDPDEMRNLALEPERNKEVILRLNELLNDLMAREVGVNDGSFLPEAARPKQPPQE
jgi:arylsulfatase